MDASSLASGLVGALLGVAASFSIYLIDRRHRAVMAARAVFLEAARDETFLKHLAESGLSAGPITDAAFNANLPLLCSLLTEEEIRTVGAPYLFVAECERLRQAFTSGNPLNVDQRNLLASTHNDFIEATIVLRRRAYGAPHAKSQVSAGQ